MRINLSKWNRVVLFLILFTLFFISPTLAQVIKGNVINESTQAPLAYVHIGVLGKNLGTISREDGSFELTLKDTGPNDTLAFSMIGFENKRMALKAISENFFQVKLKAVSYKLSLITISKSKLIKKSESLKKIGAKSSVSTMSGGNMGWGGEIGIKIRNSGKLLKARKINFKLNTVHSDSVLFRVNFYTIKNDMPKKSILDKEIFVKAYNGETWVSREIGHEGVFFEEDVIVTLETVRIWSSKPMGTALFFKKRIMYESKVYLKESSMAEWKTGEDPKITLNLDVEKYKRKK